MRISHFFIDHPRFAAVLSIFVTLFGLAAMTLLPVAQYPEIILEVTADPALTDIVVSRYDAGIRLGHRIARDMIAVRVTDDLRAVVVASPDYLARHPRPA